MQTTHDFLNAVAMKHGGASDYRLAKILSVNKSSISALRNGKSFLGDDTAIKVAVELGLEAGYVLACIHAERAKAPELRTAWERVAVRVAAAVVLGIGIGGVLAGAPDLAPLSLVAQGGEVCILCKMPVHFQDIDFNPVYLAIVLLGLPLLLRRAR